MPCTVNKGRNKVKFEDVWDTGVIFSKKTSESLLSKNGCRKDGKRSFVPVDVQIEESNVTLLFLFLSERDGVGLTIKEG